MSKSGTSKPMSATEFLKMAQEKFKNSPPLTQEDIDKTTELIKQLGGVGAMIPVPKEKT